MRLRGDESRSEAHKMVAMVYNTGKGSCTCDTVMSQKLLFESDWIPVIKHNVVLAPSSLWMPRPLEVVRLKRWLFQPQAKELLLCMSSCRNTTDQLLKTGPKTLLWHLPKSYPFLTIMLFASRWKCISITFSSSALHMLNSSVYNGHHLTCLKSLFPLLWSVFAS